MSTTSQDSYCTAWKPGCRGLWAALCHVKRIHPWLWRFFFFFFKNTPRLFTMQITATSLNPTASFGNQAPLSHHRWRASQLCCRVRWGTNVSVSVRGRERERVAKKGTEWKQWRREKKKGEGRESGPTGHREKCGGSMSASDKGISLPPVGQKERLTMQVLPPPRARA